MTCRGGWAAAPPSDSEESLLCRLQGEGSGLQLRSLSRKSPPPGAKDAWGRGVVKELTGLLADPSECSYVRAVRGICSMGMLLADSHWVPRRGW